MGDLDKWIESIKRCELLQEIDLKHLCEYVQEIMLEESTVQPVQSPVTICGDIHGQFHDLLELFRNGGECPHTSYIFMVRAGALPSSYRDSLACLGSVGQNFLGAASSVPDIGA